MKARARNKHIRDMTRRRKKQVQGSNEEKKLCHISDVILHADRDGRERERERD